MNHLPVLGVVGSLLAGAIVSAAPPTAPTNLSSRPAGPTSLILEWSDTSTDETGFRLERENGPSWDLVATLGPDEERHTVEGLGVNSSGSYRVIAFNDDGTSVPSNSTIGTTSIKMNVIFFLADDMGVKDIVALRDPFIDGPTIYETPHLDQFVTESMRFNRAYCSGPKCVVSRRSMLTGMVDFRKEAVAQGGGIGAEMITFGEAMQAGGYGTAYIGKWHLGGLPDHPDRMPAQQGFGTSIAAGDYGAPTPSYFPEPVAGTNPQEYSYNMPDLANTLVADEYLTDRLTTEAQGFITTHNTNSPAQPFFLTLAHYAVHTPLEAKQTDIDYFTARKAALATELATHPKANTPFETDYSNRGRNIQDQVVYAAMMKSFDDSLGSLRTYLAATNDPRNPGKKLSETTVIILSSDHGGKSGFWAGATPKDDQIPTANYPLRYGKTWCYEGGLRIPLIVYWPGVSQPDTQSDALVHGADFYKSFLEISNSPLVPTQHKDSISFAASIADPFVQNRTESFHWFNNAETGTGNTGLGAYISEDYKLIYHLHRRIFELYNLREDPSEENNIATLRPDLVREMYRKLNAKRIEVGKTASKPSQNGWQKEIQVLTPIMTIPPVPDAAATGVTGSASSQSVIDVIWTDNATNEEWYIVERQTGGSGGYEEIAVLPANTTSFRDTGLTPSTAYKYRIQTESLGGWTASPPTSSSITTLATGNLTPIVANDDFVTTLINELRTFTPLTNDAGDDLSITGITQPSNGTAFFTGSDITYKPSLDNTGIDTLTYTIADSDGNTATATVTLDTLANHDPPAPPTTFGAYWAFQLEQGGTSGANSTYTGDVTFHNLPTNPTFNRTGDQLSQFGAQGNYNFTHFGGETWEQGRTTTWNGNSGPSSNNTFSITVDTTGAENFSVRFGYRNNGLQTAPGTLLTSLTSFEYKVGSGGSFTPVPGANLTLDNNTTYNTWSANLALLNAIENQPEVTLRWTIPDFIQAASTQIRIDDLQISGSAMGPPPPRERLLPEGAFNILFLPIDDLKPLINAYGEEAPLRPITPNMDRLAARGVTFTNAHCQQAICNASRASIMTGMRPDYTRCWKLSTFFRDIHPNIKTIPQHFGENGYTVFGTGKIYHGGGTAKQDPISWPDGYVTNSRHSYYEPAKATLEDAGDQNASATDAGQFKRDGVTPIEDKDYTDGANTETGVAKISELAAAGDPFFLAVGLKKPHLPFACPKSYWDLYDPAQIDLTGYTGIEELPTGTNDFTAPYSGEPAAYSDIAGVPNATEARHLIHGYLACVSFADAQIGKLLDALEDPDGNPATDDSITDNTVIVLWGDHGWHLGDHNGFWAKHSNYEQSTRVPFIISAPGMKDLGSKGRKCTAPVELVDVFPTLAEICGLSLPIQPGSEPLQGTSLMPLLEDPNQPWKKAAFSQFQRNINGPGVTNSGNGMGYSIRTDRYRYTEWWRTTSSNDTLDFDEIIGTSPEHIELYDYLSDPGETINLASDPAYAAIVTELSQCLNHGDNTRSGDGWKQAAVDAPAEFPDTYAMWTNTHYFPGTEGNAFDQNQDPDGDGWINLFEYKFGTHPLIKDSPNLRLELDNGGLYIRYPDVTSRTDVTLTPYASTDLNSWSNSGIIDNPDQGTVGNATIRSSRFPGTSLSKLFLRIKAESP